MTIVGYAGPDIRADIRVTVQDAPTASVSLDSPVEGMYGDSIRAQVDRILGTFGHPHVQIHLQDSGALPFVIEARIEAALSRHVAKPLPSIERIVRECPRDRSRRTRLYVPGNSPKLLPNAGLYGADCVIFDLEDAVAPDQKDAARALVRRALEVVDFGTSEPIVRINSGELGVVDIEALVPANPAVFLIPKAESVEQMRALSARLDELESNAYLIAILESAKSIENAREIADSTPRLVAITLGVEDYLADIGATDPSATDWANGAILNAARSAGISPLASVTSTIHDDDLIRRFATKMASLGFEGVGCIHPRQVGPAHEGFAPNHDALQAARRVVEAFEKAVSNSSGVLAVDGKMVDLPVYERAKRTLRWAGESH